MTCKACELGAKAIDEMAEDYRKNGPVGSGIAGVIGNAAVTALERAAKVIRDQCNHSSAGSVVVPREFFDWSGAKPRYITANGVPMQMPKKQENMLSAPDAGQKDAEGEQNATAPVAAPEPQSLSDFVHAPESVRERIGQDVVERATEAQRKKMAAPEGGREGTAPGEAGLAERLMEIWRVYHLPECREAAVRLSRRPEAVGGLPEPTGKKYKCEYCGEEDDLLINASFHFCDANVLTGVIDKLRAALAVDVWEQAARICRDEQAKTADKGEGRSAVWDDGRANGCDDCERAIRARAEKEKGNE